MTLTPHLPALQVLIPMLTAPFVLLLPGGGLARLATLAASLMAFAIAMSLTGLVVSEGGANYAMGSWPAPFGIQLRVSAFSAMMLLVVTGASSIALIAGRDELHTGRDGESLFYAAWLLALAGLVGIVVAGDAFNIFVFMEISSLASYVLIAGGTDRRALPAVFKYLVMGTVGATFYLIGVGLIYMMTGTLDLADMEARIGGVGELRPILVAAGFITVGLALKAAMFPLHVWLPNTYTYAPHLVTVFLAACSTKVSLYVLLRFDFLVFQQNLAAHAFQFSVFLIPLAVIAILVGSAVAIGERNIKRMLAYSSISQIGYILLGASMVSIIGLTAGITHMFNHALAKGALFLAVACLATRVPVVRMDEIRGIAKQMPLTMMAFVIAGFSLIGVPGTAGFISKWYLIGAAMEQGNLGIFMIAIILISSLMAVVYIWRVVEAAYFSKVPDSIFGKKEAPWPLLTATWAVVLANIYFGLLPEIPVSLATQAAETLLEHLP